MALRGVGYVTAGPNELFPLADGAEKPRNRAGLLPRGGPRRPDTITSM